MNFKNRKNKTFFIGILKVDYQVKQLNTFKRCFPLKKQTIKFPFSSNFYFQ